MKTKIAMAHSHNMNTTQKIILGTVQFGLEYGINNTAGKPSSSDVFSILDIAMEKGIFLLDTAESYGNAIELVGNYHRQSGKMFQVICKFRTFSEMNLVQNVGDAIEKLHIPRLYACFLHNADDLSKSSEKQLNELKLKGLSKYSGVSVYTNQQFKEAIEASYIDIIQIPYNILDNINLRGALIKEAKSRNKIIHIRSVFLQGLFFMDEKKIPEKLQPLQKYLQQINELCKSFSISKEALAMNYAIQNNDIDGVLAGVDSAAQLLANIEAASQEIPVDATEMINKLHVLETALLNPSNWN